MNKKIYYADILKNITSYEHYITLKIFTIFYLHLMMTMTIYENSYKGKMD